MMLVGRCASNSSSAPGDQSGYLRSSAELLEQQARHQFLVQLREARDQFFAGGSLHCSLLGG
jgi:hypothetical protein